MNRRRLKRQERITANGENKDKEIDKFRLKIINRYIGRGVTEARRMGGRRQKRRRARGVRRQGPRWRSKSGIQ